MQSFTRASRTLARMAWCEQRLTAAAVRPLHVSVSAAAEAMPLPSVEKVIELDCFIDDCNIIGLYLDIRRQDRANS